MSDEIYKDQSERKELHKFKTKTGTHHYYFDIKEAKTGSKYIVISQNKKSNDEFVSVKMRIFEDEMNEFQRVMEKSIAYALNHTETPRAIDSESVQKEEEADTNFDSELYPVFFNKLLNTHDWEKFEEYTYFLLKLLGIHSVYKFLGEIQAGKADGFFKFGNLAVLYDCTLNNTNIEESKKEQIINYCNRLQQGSIELSGNKIEEFHKFKKQVWIITKGNSRVIKTINDIAVKEISIQDVMSIYKERLKNNISDEQLKNKIGDI